MPVLLATTLLLAAVVVLDPVLAAVLLAPVLLIVELARMELAGCDVLLGVADEHLRHHVLFRPGNALKQPSAT